MDVCFCVCLFVFVYSLTCLHKTAMYGAVYFCVFLCNVHFVFYLYSVIARAKETQRYVNVFIMPQVIVTGVVVMVHGTSKSGVIRRHMYKYVHSKQVRWCHTKINTPVSVCVCVCVQVLYKCVNR